MLFWLFGNIKKYFFAVSSTNVLTNFNLLFSGDDLPFDPRHLGSMGPAAGEEQAGRRRLLGLVRGDGARAAGGCHARISPLSAFFYLVVYYNIKSIYPQLSGVLAENVGWESIFYVFGVLGLSWCVAWWWVVRDSPEEDRNITDEELEYLRTAIGVSTQVMMWTTTNKSAIIRMNNCFGILGELDDTPLEEDADVQGCLGHHHRPLCRELGFLHAAHGTANVHER